MKSRLLAAAFALALPMTSWGGSKDRTLDIYWIDSMGGGSTLIVTPTDESILIDTGNPGGRDSGRIHKVAKETAGIGSIDHLVVTHFHVDHFGGAAELSQLMPIRHVHDNGIPEKDPDGRDDASWPLKIRAYRTMNCEKRSVIQAGEKLPLGQAPGAPPLSMTCLAAKQKVAIAIPSLVVGPGCMDTNAQPVDTSDNANSVVTLLEFGGFRFFDGGDLTWNTEASLACPFPQFASVDVYQVNHHGLDVSNNPLLLRALAPSVSVMNNGPEKGCGAATFQTLRSIPTLQAMYQLHRNVRADSENNTATQYCANNGKESGGNFIRLSVSPDGRTYTISIPATGHQRTFLTRL